MSKRVTPGTPNGKTGAVVHSGTLTMPPDLLHRAFRAQTSAELAASATHREWAIEDVLATGQAAVLLGEQNSLKTSFAVDMAVSLGSGTRFLRQFEVSRRRRVAFFDGASTSHDLCEVAERVCKDRALSLGDCHIVWVPQMPDLADDAGRNEFLLFLQWNGIEVAIFDTLEQAPFDGIIQEGTGDLLRAAAEVCAAASTTPVFVQHVVATKVRSEDRWESVARPNAGNYPFVRQWLVISQDHVRNRDPRYQLTVLFHVHDRSGREFRHRVTVTEEAGEGQVWRRRTAPLRATPVPFTGLVHRP